MKKILLSALGVLFALPGLAQDFTYEYEGQILTYTILDEEAKTCGVKQGEWNNEGSGWIPGNNVSGTLVIPEIVKDGENEYTVTEIGDFAFDGTGLTSVTIPNSVITIGSSAFDTCASLTTVAFGNSLTTIGHNAFNDCKALISVILPDALTTLESGAFQSCSALASVTFGNSVTTIGSSAFSFCNSLKSVVLPESLVTIGDSAFLSCSSLMSVTISDAVTTVGSSAFTGCTSLETVTFGKSLTTVSPYAFQQCVNLTSVEIPEGITSIQEGAFSYCEKLASVTIPGTVTSIGDLAFSGCAMTSLSLPTGLTTLGKNSFDSCPLAEIILPESLKTIGDECFKDCPLTAVRFGQNIERIGSNAFSTLSQFEVNENLVSFGDKAFGENFRLLKISRDNPPQLDSKNMGYTDDEAYNILVIVPANGDDVYKNDPKWEGFHIVETAPTKTVYMTGRYPLSEEITTTTQQMPGNVTSLAIVGPLADDDWNIIKRNLISCYDLDLSGVTNTEIPAETFADNQHILTLKLPNGLKTIGDKTFLGCNNLTMEALPASVETIGESAFENCTVFNVEALPESLRTIGVKAFANCSRLQLSTLPAVETIGAGAFYNCPRFMDLDMSAAKFTDIEAGTFANCGKLRNITLPETLASIKGGEGFWYDYTTMGAFQNTAVNFVAFPATLREIGGNAFRNTALISVELPRQFNAVDKGSFAECPMIKSVSLSSKMQNIGEEAFLDCRGIKSISVPCAVPPTVGDKAFSNVRYRDVVVSIPTMNYRDYLNALGWGAFTQLANSIFLEYEEVDENGNSLSESTAEQDNVEVGTAENGTYDEIVNNIVSEEEQAAEDKALDEALYGEENVAPAEIAARVKRARAAARAEAEYTADAKARQAFSRLYTGQSMTIGDNTGYRVKIQPKEGVEIVKIEFGGKDITNTYIDGMVTLPALYSRSSLKVYRKAPQSGVENVTGSDRNATADVYSLQGIVVLRDATEAQVSRLNPGMYIYKGRKIVIR